MFSLHFTPAAEVPLTAHLLPAAHLPLAVQSTPTVTPILLPHVCTSLTPPCIQHHDGPPRLKAARMVSACTQRGRLWLLQADKQQQG